MLQGAINPSSSRELLTRLYRVAVEAAHGGRALLENARVDGDLWLYSGSEPLAVPLPAARSNGRVLVVGAGKAAATMARGMEDVLGERISDGIVVVKYRHGEPLSRIRIREAAHPIPDAAGVAGTRDVVRLLDTTTAEDTVFCVLSGGASSLLVAPAAGLSLEDKARTTQLLVNSGASIHEVNVVRKQLSAVKGGRLRRPHCRAFCTLAISDVIGDEPSVIGSGPTVPDTSTREQALRIVARYELRSVLPAAVVAHLQCNDLAINRAAPLHEREAFRIIASIRLSIDACVREATRLGVSVKVLSRQMTGNTHDAALDFAAAAREVASTCSAPTLLIAGGETTLTVTGVGRGGRNQEFALVAARALQDVPHCTVLAAGTDGTDGPTDAGGAFVDESTLARASAKGLDMDAYLRRNDSYPLFTALGDLFVTGPTGTNVMDLVLGLVY